MTGYPEVILRIGPDKRACWRTASKELCNRRTQLTSRLRLPTWNSLPLPSACDLLGTHLPPYIYEIPRLCTLGVRPATLSFMNCRKAWSKQPGSSWLVPGKPGRHVHP